MQNQITAFPGREKDNHWLGEIRSNADLCVRCGNTEDSSGNPLIWHHRDPSEKKFEVSRYGSMAGFSKEDLLKEIEKCDRLCLDCHYQAHRRVGSGPLPPDSFGGRVRATRIARGMSQRSLAYACGLSRSYMCDIERRHVIIPKITVVMRIAVALDISVDELIGIGQHPIESGKDRLRSDIIRVSELLDEATSLLNKIKNLMV